MIKSVVENNRARTWSLIFVTVLLATGALTFAALRAPAARAGLLGCGEAATSYSGNSYHVSENQSATLRFYPVTFNSDGSVKNNGSNNYGNGTWSVDGTALTFTILTYFNSPRTFTSTLRACDTSSGTGKVGYVAGRSSGPGKEGVFHMVPAS